MFATLSDRLADTFKNLRGKGRLSEADIDATAREIRIALLEGWSPSLWSRSSSARSRSGPGERKSAVR